MYDLKFEKSNGDIYYFDAGHRLQYDLEPLSELDISLYTSQGVSQIGATLENRAVDGVDRVITGRFLGYADDRKREMLDAFSPFAEGKLYFNNRFYCDCVVKATPAIGSAKWDPGFSVQLYCPYPFWLEKDSTVEQINTYTACFRFPGPVSGENGEYTGYGTHIYAVENQAAFINIRNPSNVDTRFSVTFASSGHISDYGLLNIRTLEQIRMNDELSAGSKVSLTWQDDMLSVIKTVNGVEENVFALLDESSNLFVLHPGDNILKPFGDGGYPISTIVYNAAYAGVYDGMEGI